VPGLRTFSLPLLWYGREGSPSLPFLSSRPHPARPDLVGIGPTRFFESLLLSALFSSFFGRMLPPPLPISDDHKASRIPFFSREGLLRSRPYQDSIPLPLLRISPLCFFESRLPSLLSFSLSFKSPPSESFLFFSS